MFITFLWLVFISNCMVVISNIIKKDNIKYSFFNILYIVIFLIANKLNMIG